MTGEDAADASRSAAADTYKKQNDAIASLLGYGDQYASKFADLAKGYDPYVATGYESNDALRKLIADPTSVRQLPGYDFNFTEGLRGIDRGAAARSGVNNGATIKAEQKFGTGLADQSYGAQLSRLMALSGQGQGALTAQNSTVGAGLQGQLGTRTAGYNGQMTAANTIGLGDVAAANAEAAGSQNLLNAALKIGGMAVGAGGGGSSFATSTGANPFGALMSSSGSNPFNPDGSRNTLAYGP